jgi:hypothetical protein
LTSIPAKWYEPVKAILEEVILFDSGISEREIEQCGTYISRKIKKEAQP